MMPDELTDMSGDDEVPSKNQELISSALNDHQQARYFRRAAFYSGIALSVILFGFSLFWTFDAGRWIIKGHHNIALFIGPLFGLLSAASALFISLLRYAFASRIQKIEPEESSISNLLKETIGLLKDFAKTRIGE